MDHRPWCDITPEVAEKARQAGRNFGSRRSSMQKNAFIKEVIDAESSILRMQITSGDAIGNAQEISRLFASAAMHRWHEMNEVSPNGQGSDVISFPGDHTRGRSSKPPS